MIIVGVGVEPGTAPAHLVDAVVAAGLGLDEIGVVATVTDRADEPAVRAVLRPPAVLRTYDYPALAAVDVPNPSAVVRRLTGSGSVAEAAALLAAREIDPAAVLCVQKRRGTGVTVAAARV